MSIQFIDRETGETKQEKVYGGGLVRFLYSTRLGSVIESALARRLLSDVYGLYQSSGISRRKVNRFISDFDLDMSEYVAGPFNSFNDFFIREFRSGARTFPSDSTTMGAVAEGRYLGYETITPEMSFPVKGQYLSSEALLDHPKYNQRFMGGPLIIARLCPVDYHRFHFPDSGKERDRYERQGQYHSVNPLALSKIPQVFCINKRSISILETENFGELAYIEVGAMCVGEIAQSYKVKSSFSRGQEKGYFLFGGSTVILIGTPGSWIPSKDILINTGNKIETFVKLGDRIAECH